jgi:hypothetical protein
MMLTALRLPDDVRTGTGPLADMFRLLTTDPVQGVADPSRSARALGLAKALPSALEAMQPPVRAPYADICSCTLPPLSLCAGALGPRGRSRGVFARVQQAVCW